MKRRPQKVLTVNGGGSVTVVPVRLRRGMRARWPLPPPPAPGLPVRDATAAMQQLARRPAARRRAARRAVMPASDAMASMRRVIKKMT